MSSTMHFALLIVTAALISPLLAQMDEGVLGKDTLERCYKRRAFLDDILYINGQEHPLANSLDNFINLAEKFELANPGLDLKQELIILLENYTTENVFYSLQDDKGSLDNAGFPIGLKPGNIDSIGSVTSRSEIEKHNDPFNDDEKCSLFFMLTRSVNNSALFGIDSTDNSNGRLDVYYPREQGVVSIYNSKTDAISLRRVLLGLHLGLKDDSLVKLSEYIETLDKKRKVDMASMGLGDDDDVLLLYMLTLADQLVIANAPAGSKGFLKSGTWKSVKKSNTDDDKLDTICPMVYVLSPDSEETYTHSSIQGGVDGLILGSIIPGIYNEQPKSKVRLSQILRMYYSPSGIQENSNAPHLLHPASFCKRSEGISSFIETLKTQVTIYTALVFNNPSLEISEKVYKLFTDNMNNVVKLSEDLDEICKDIKIDESYGSYKTETFVDIVVVLDTENANEESLKNQRLIIGYLAKNLDIRNNGSSLTVFLDRKNDTYGNYPTDILGRTFSSACAACYINQFEMPDGTFMEKDYVIDAIATTLYDMKKVDEDLHAARGKVVIYFNFAEEGKVEYRPYKVMSNFYKQHPDVEVLAVGHDKETLKVYAQGNSHNVIVVSNVETSEVAMSIQKKIEEVPARLQYKECKTGKDESSARFKGLVSPRTLQRWSMRADYFYKSYVPKIFFEVEKGDITVCSSRAGRITEKEQKNCKYTDPSRRKLEFENKNPCDGFEKESCSDIFFTVIGKGVLQDPENTENQQSLQTLCDDTPDTRCKTLDQIAFTVTHEGIRCSGCMKILSSPLVLLAVCFITYFMKFAS